MAEKVDYPKLLSFERRIAPSDGIFFGCRWDSRNDENLLDVLRIEEGREGHYLKSGGFDKR